MKIPWKNLYGGSVEASIDSLFLLVVPTQDVTYDIEKEEKNKQTAKQNEILRIENIKLMDQQKSSMCTSININLYTILWFSCVWFYLFSGCMQDSKRVKNCITSHTIVKLPQNFQIIIYFFYLLAL